MDWGLARGNNPEYQSGSADACGAIGVDESDLLLPEVFPNPASDHITLRLPGAWQNAERIHVTDVTGRVVHSEQLNGSASLLLHAAAWGTGSYFITVFIEGRIPVSVRVSVVN